MLYDWFGFILVLFYATLSIFFMNLALCTGALLEDTLLNMLQKQVKNNK